ncbi:urease accessory protein UreE [Alteribacillus sp. HJP-4]|uniref:urease accessory protein UreE n=1 Tax=Alteribacillus sp. HJP-4 TaxID=2775394 RepID=UPI0035CCFF39
MKITKPVGRINPKESTKKKREWLELEWEELNKRILRKNTDQGRDMAISLEDGIELSPGDVIFEDEETEVVVTTVLEDVFVLVPESIEEMGKAAFELGNRHTPCLIENGEIIVRFDKLLPDLFMEVGITFFKDQRRFHKPFKYKGQQHEHAH